MKSVRSLWPAQYLTAALVVEATGAAPRPASELHAATAVIVIQTVFAALYGLMAGLAIRKAWRSQLTRYTPWHGFMSMGRGQYVIVYTTSSKRYYGWIKQASSGDEARREVVLGDPVRINKDDTMIDMGSEILFCENEIARVVRVRFSDKSP